MPRSRSKLVLGLVLGLAACPGTRPAGTPKCPQDRTVLIGSQDDVLRHAACESLSSLTVRTGAPVDLTPLSTLVTITGDLDVGPTIGIEELKLSELREVGGTVRIASNTSLQGLFLPRLEKAGRIEIESNASLTTIVLRRLTTVAGAFVVAGNSLLEIMDISELATIGRDLVVADNGSLTLIEGGKLASVQEVRIERNKKLPADAADGLRVKTPPP
jgi:hypothetical protein